MNMRQAAEWSRFEAGVSRARPSNFPAPGPRRNVKATAHQFVPDAKGDQGGAHGIEGEPAYPRDDREDDETTQADLQRDAHRGLLKRSVAHQRGRNADRARCRGKHEAEPYIDVHFARSISQVQAQS